MSGCILGNSKEIEGQQGAEDYHKNLKDYTKAIEKYERGLPKVRKFADLPVEYSLLENL